MLYLWSIRHQQAFDSAKVLATSAACLEYFDVTAPLINQVDASDYGQGAALLQPIKPLSSSALDEFSLRPIAYSKRPNHYREALCANRKGVPGYCWSPQHIWVMAFWKIQHRVYTDHQPLQSILKRDLALAPKCLERILLLLRRYKFTFLYRKGSLLHLADTVSRASRQDEAVNPSMSDSSSLYRYHSRATTQCHIIMPRHALSAALPPQRFAKNSAL